MTYIITNQAEIEAAMDGNAPRDVEEIMREMYPDCVIDANGRAHAPQDGYLCTMTDRVFRGGEYLPESDEAIGNQSLRKLFCMDSVTRKLVIFEGTQAQIEAAKEIAKAQQTAFDGTREFVGSEKSRVIIENLTIMSVFHQIGMYGHEYTHYMRDEYLNPIVYKGSKILKETNGSLAIKVTVKSHWQCSCDERKATYVSRPVII